MTKTENHNQVEIKEFDFRFANISALIIKVTNKCNLDCKYCYEAISKQGDFLPIETFKSIAVKAIASSINDKITFIFHGGEPMLVHADWYSEAVSFCNYLGEKFSKTIIYGLQTNLISVSDSKLLELKKIGINISASIDAHNDIQTPERGFSNKAIQNFYRAKALDINISVLSTINKSNFNSFGTFIDFLKNNFGVKSFKANVAYPVGFGEFAEQLNPDEIFQAKRDILTKMISDKGQGINEINILKQIQKYFNTSDNCQNELCDKQTCGAGKSVLGFTHTGEILPCGRFAWNDKTYYLGSVYDQGDIRKEIFENSISNFQNKNPENWVDCKTCPAKVICNFGCQAFISRSINKANIECLSTKMLHNYFQENQADLKIIYDNNYSRIETGYHDYSDHYSAPPSELQLH